MAAGNVDAKLLKQTKFPPEFNTKVDVKKVNLDVLKRWIAGKISELLGTEDDVVTELCYGLLDNDRFPDIKKLQIQLTGFLDKDTPKFCKDLWNLCLSAQDSPTGVPKELIEAKKQQLLQERLEPERVTEAAKQRKVAEADRERNTDRIRQSKLDDRNRGRGGHGAGGGRGRRGDYESRGYQPRDRYRQYSRSPPPPRGGYHHDRYQARPQEIDRYEPSNRRGGRERGFDRYDGRGARYRGGRRRSPSYSRTPSRSASRSRSVSRSASDSRSRSRSRSRSGSRSINPPRRGNRRSRSPARHYRRHRSVSTSYESSRSRSPRRRRDYRRDRRSYSRSRSPPRRHHERYRSDKRDRRHSQDRRPSTSSRSRSSNRQDDRLARRGNRSQFQHENRSRDQSPPAQKPDTDDVPQESRKRSRALSEDPNRTPTPPLRKGRGFQNQQNEMRGILSRDRYSSTPEDDQGYRISSQRRREDEERASKRTRVRSRLSPEVRDMRIEDERRQGKRGGSGGSGEEERKTSHGFAGKKDESMEDRAAALRERIKLNRRRSEDERATID